MIGITNVGRFEINIPLLWYTTEEAAALLKVAESTIRGWIAQGALVASHIGERIIRISSLDLWDFMERHKTPTLPEIYNTESLEQRQLQESPQRI